ncbi:MAG: hypothetical protein M3494_13765 [Actinomycetota bacterium]|nr:hypothetical protein [Rubrobacter sp.]MDQ3509056.1 hypothetical protein [Actinomycetota bacterium]
MESENRRTPEASLKAVFLEAASAFPEEGERAEVVGEALDFLQNGFDAHYENSEGEAAGNDDILVGDNDYAWAVETIARLDEPRFVAVAGRMIRDGAGRISAGKSVSVESWTPHLAQLLDIVSGEGEKPSEERIKKAAEVSS